MTQAIVEAFIPRMPAPYRRGQHRLDKESWWEWRDGFAFWMKRRGVERPTRAVRLHAVVRRLVGGRRNPVWPETVSAWRLAVEQAAQHWSPLAMVASVTFEPLEGDATLENLTRVGTHVTIEEDE